MEPFLFIFLGYLCGSIPTAYLVARARGVDVFSTGTGNPGAANVFRTVGRGAGIAVLAGDLLKGAAPVAAALLAGLPEWWAYGAGLAALAGHWYSVFLRFRGGAGLATGVGAGLALMPLPGLVAFFLALAVLSWRKDTGKTTAIGYAILMGLGVVVFKEPIPLVVAVTLMPALALLRERLLPKVGAGI